MDEPTTFWTLEISGTERSAADWEIGGVSLSRRSLEEDKLKFEIDGQPFDTADVFPYGAPLIVRRDRVQALDGSFGGGTIYFQGVSLGGRRTANGRSEKVSYTAAGPWWWLKQDCFEQLIPPLGGYTTHVVLNLNATTSAMVGLDAQLDQILDDALAKYGPVFQYDPASFSEFALCFPPSDEKRDLTHAEALKDELKWSPRTVAWFDYSQQPPALHVRSAINLPVATLDLLDGVSVVSEDIVARYDMQISQCIIRYEQTNKIGNNSNFVVTTDKYPASATAVVGKMRTSVNLTGMSGTEQLATIVTSDIVADPQTTAFWTAEHPHLLNVTNLVIHDEAFIDPATGDAPATLLPFYFVEGVFHKWMRVGNSNAGDPALHKDIHVYALADYTDQFGNILVDEEITVKKKSTNLASGTYSRIKISTFAEPVPIGLAKYFYGILSVLPWEGEIAVEGDEVTPAQFLGCTLNLTNGLPAWATMSATVTSVDEDVDAGRVVVKFGPNKWLSPEEIVDLIRVTRVRHYSFYANSMIHGSGENSDVESADATGKDNSAKGRAEVNRLVTSYTDPADPTGNTQTRITKDAINGAFTIDSKDGTKGSIVVSLADMNAALA